MKKTLSRLAALVFGSTLACAAQAAEPGKLQVWVNKDKCFDAWTKIAQDYTRRTGVAVKVDATIPDFFQNQAVAGKAPDIVIWAHDTLGKWVADGLLAPLTPSPRALAALDPLALQAFKLGGRYWGYPIGSEAVHLIYNRKLVQTPPKSFEEVEALDRKFAGSGHKAILWDLEHIYYSWPLLAANGAYAFKVRAEGGWNPDQIGVNNAGALKGANLIARLVKTGVLPGGASREDAEAAFREGRVAMIIDGPWAWEAIRKAGVDFGTAPIPRVAGKPGAPFVGVIGAMLSRSSPNQKLATQYIENVLLSHAALKACNADKSLGVPADLKLRAELAADPRVRGMSEAARFGLPMPNNPEMRFFWGPMETATAALVSGKPPKEVLDAAAKRIRER